MFIQKRVWLVSALALLLIPQFGLLKVTAVQSADGGTTLDDFEGSLGAWSAEPHSGIEISSKPVSSGKAALKWTLHSDGVNTYGNNILFKPPVKDWSNYTSILVDFYSAGPIEGRIGCQISADGKEITLDDLNSFAKEGEWKTIEIPLSDNPRESVAWLRFFCDGTSYQKGDHVFYLDNLRLARAGEKRSEIHGDPLPAFSNLSSEKQAAIREAVAPPPLGQRRNPYSTPMYYQMWGGSSFDGKMHEDWQEALVKDWAAAGMTKLHLYLYPSGNGTENRQYTLSEADRDGMRMLVRVCKKYGVKLGLRVDLPYTLDKSGSEPTSDFWIAHPNNPHNELPPYWGWLSQVITTLKGNLEYVILGDEMDWKKQDKEKAWNADLYMKVFAQAAETIHQADPAVKVSMYGASSGRWNEVLALLQNGYTKYGDAIAINHYDYNVLRGFQEDLKKYSPAKKLLMLSNGVGYISSDTSRRDPPKDPYSHYNDQDQAAMIARTMYTWWDVDAGVAPYYVCMRGYTYKGEYHPWWYGFFGFMELNIDDAGTASIKHYPAWYAYQTVANVFHDRDAFHEPEFKVQADGANPQYLKAHERPGKELVVMLWGSGNGHSKTNIHIDSTHYGYPVQLDLLDYQKWSDVSAMKDAEGITLMNVPVGLAPTIIRLVPL
jgi:hypothetical protein